MLLRVLFIALLLAVPAAAEDAFFSSPEALGRTPSDLAVERVTLKSMPVAILKSEGKLTEAPQELPKAIEVLRAKLKEKNIESAGAPLAVFSAADEDNYSAEVMIPLKETPKEPGDLQLGKSPAGKALRIVHKGPLSSLEDSYFELSTFVEDQATAINDVTIERYVADALIEIYVPLQ